ncbi:hypothetical protein GCM10022252_34060 [Streptosporangium oxazolinicum]|uniref:Uncharacterized protein n=1 Tax=Streptosporangium oxazolinicum TaxID=909287 RepID=A0ABP8AX38_9ACTN
MIAPSATAFGGGQKQRGDARPGVIGQFMATNHVLYPVTRSLWRQANGVTAGESEGPQGLSPGVWGEAPINHGLSVMRAQCDDPARPKTPVAPFNTQ